MILPYDFAILKATDMKNLGTKFVQLNKFVSKNSIKMLLRSINNKEIIRKLTHLSSTNQGDVKSRKPRILLEQISSTKTKST